MARRHIYQWDLCCMKSVPYTQNHRSPSLSRLLSPLFYIYILELIFSVLMFWMWKSRRLIESEQSQLFFVSKMLFHHYLGFYFTFKLWKNLPEAASCLSITQSRSACLFVTKEKFSIWFSHWIASGSTTGFVYSLNFCRQIFWFVNNQISHDRDWTWRFPLLWQGLIWRGSDRDAVPTRNCYYFGHCPAALEIIVGNDKNFILISHFQLNTWVNFLLNLITREAIFTEKVNCTKLPFQAPAVKLLCES